MMDSALIVNSGFMRSLQETETVSQGEKGSIWWAQGYTRGQEDIQEGHRDIQCGDTQTDKPSECHEVRESHWCQPPKSIPNQNIGQWGPTGSSGPLS